jgi:hypothetical protein
MQSFRPSRSAVFCGLMLALATLGLTSCKVYYKIPQNTFGGRPVPPSLLFERVMVGVTANGTQGFLQVLDGLRDIRGNIQDTRQTFPISGYSGGYPSQIYNFPEQSKGFVYSSSDGPSPPSTTAPKPPAVPLQPFPQPPPPSPSPPTSFVSSQRKRTPGSSPSSITASAVPMRSTCRTSSRS